MGEYYLVKLKSNKFLRKYDVGIKIPSNLIEDIEKLLFDRPHELVLMDDDINLNVESEMSYLYNLLLREKNFYADTWHLTTNLEKHYCAKTKSPVMPKEYLERVLKYSKSKKFFDLSSDKVYYKFDGQTILLLTKDEVIEFRNAYDRAEKDIKKIENIIDKIKNFASSKGFKLKGDEHLLVNGKPLEIDTSQANSTADEFAGRAYIDLE